MISQRLFNVYMDGVVREVNVMVLRRMLDCCMHDTSFCLQMIDIVVVAVSVVGQTIGSINSKTLAYDCLRNLELCTASMTSNSKLGYLGDFPSSVCLSGS